MVRLLLPPLPRVIRAEHGAELADVGATPTFTGSVPEALAPRLDWRLALFVLVTAALTALLVGLLPALQLTRVDLQAVLEGPRPAAEEDASCPGSWWRRWRCRWSCW